MNATTVKDSYPLPLQPDIIYTLLGCKFITVFDALSFFDQWLVADEDQSRFTCNTADGQLRFNVAVVGYCGSVQYVQRGLDHILRIAENICLRAPRRRSQEFRAQLLIRDCAPGGREPQRVKVHFELSEDVPLS
jgi:hypothetical protein